MAQVNKCAAGAWSPVPKKPGVKGFAKYYYNYEVKQVVKKVGEGEDDFVLEDKIITHRDLIQSVLDAQADQVGVYNIIERAVRTGDNSLLKSAQVHVSDEILDITNAPTDLADGLHKAQASQAAYASLDPALTKGRTLEQFLLTITPDEFAAWQASLKKTEKKEGDE